MITSFGRQRLAGVPGRALRLAAAALGAGREVEHALPGEVLDLAAAEHLVLVEALGSAKSIGVPVVSVTGSSGPRPSGTRLVATLTGERDVQVLERRR